MDYRAPMYLQLQTIIRAKIASGEYPPGHLIPSERALSTTYGLNRMTVRSAVQQLVDEGRLCRVQGKGTFVTKGKIVRDLLEGKGFSLSAKEYGIVPSSRVVLEETIAAPLTFMRLFGFDGPERIFFCQKLHLGDGEPMEIEEIYIPLRYAPDVESLDMDVHSAMNVLELHDRPVTRVSQSLRLVRVVGGNAELLGCDDGSAAFLLESTGRDKSGTPLVYTRSYSNGDKCKFTTLLRHPRHGKPSRSRARDKRRAPA
ncbi:MAG: GntR family transcriptional regulator [Planctomycetaceae bacterium]|nr:GntR family transcriptional regulator [Planctomycetaceae bacterium]